MADHFTPEARAELLAMYAGMAMQGLLHRHDVHGEDIGHVAVTYANILVDALEAHHAKAAAADASVVTDVAA